MPGIWWPVLGSLLASPGRRTSRGRLAAQLWPDKDEPCARHCLATALWRIKARLPAGSRLIEVGGERIALAESPRVWIDALALERRAAPCLADPRLLDDAPERRRLARALDLFRGDFLGECDTEWIALERERLRALYLDALYELALAEARAENWSAARAAAHSLCAVEPLREDAQRLLMQATANCGSRALAIQLFRAYQQLLTNELAIEPMAETVALMREIAGGLNEPPMTSPLPPHGADYRTALMRTRDEMKRTLTMVERTLAE